MTQIEIDARIASLEAELATTDYMCLKFTDGALTAAEYEPIRQQRAEYRAEINKLQECSEN